MKRTRNVTRTLRRLRKYGYEFVQRTESYHYHTKRRMDLFRFGDILALSRDKLPLMVQVKTRDPELSSYESIRDIFSSYGIKFQIWVWKKKKGIYRLRVIEVKNGHKGIKKRIVLDEWRKA